MTDGQSERKEQGQSESESEREELTTRVMKGTVNALFIIGCCHSPRICRGSSRGR
jgi:hypothetical protein